MTLPAVGDIRNFDDVKTELMRIRENLGVNDIRPSGLREESISQDSIDKGRMAISEVNGIPTIYYRSLAGTLYKLEMTAV